MDKLDSCMVVFFLILAVFFVSCTVSAETSYTRIAQETTKEMTAKDAEVLRFSSFSGGGYNYSVEVDDPSIVSFEAQYEFEEHAEEIDGASYDYIISFTGLKPGSTTAMIYVRSPIMDNENRFYTVSVDDALRVTLTPVRAISTFFLNRIGDIQYDSYQIALDADGYHVSINEEPEQPVGTDTINELLEAIETYDVVSWDGFSESKSFVLDGESFWLDFTLTDRTSVHARGDNVFPEHYFEAVSAIWDILSRITEEENSMKLYINETQVPVTWEENASVEALKTLLPLTIQMSMYGDFEQVGPIGKSIVRNDEQTITSSGDIVLYSGNQIVIFYSSNSWSYTTLGHVNLSQQEMAELLGHGDVIITISED